jgi:phosphoglycerate dehydrogenase-like enzyme
VAEIGVLVSDRFPKQSAAACERSAEGIGRSIRWIHVPPDPEARVAESLLSQIEVAYYTRDVLETRARSFFSAVRKAPDLRWLQTFNAGVDHPIFAEMLGRGIRVTTAAGTAAVPIAQCAITGLLMLARGFPAWIRAQQQHVWQPIRGSEQPPDLAGQTLCVLGLGAIGREIARLGQALGLRVVGIRRSPHSASDPVDELYPPSALDEVLAHCDWLALACPLTDETRGLIDGDMLQRLPRGARLINIARGEVVDEAALIAALQQGHLGGAYLDVFAQEPLPPDSPLWDLPNVIVSPHNSGAAAGNDARVHALFVANFARFVASQPLVNEVEPAT